MKAAQQVVAIGLQGLAGLLVGILQPGGGSSSSSGSSGIGGGGSSAGGGLATGGSGSAALGLGAASLAQTSATTEGTTTVGGITGDTSTMSASDVKANAAAANTILPTPEQVRIAAVKAVAENPPWTQWSKNDSAVRCTEQGLVKCGGYSRVGLSHGASFASCRGEYTYDWEFSYYYSYHCDCQRCQAATSAILFLRMLNSPGPTAQEITDALPPNARLGTKLQDQLQRALLQQQQQQQQS
jgi:hypothetical protein